MLHSIRRGALLALAIALAGTATAHAESTRFYSSFEPGDPQPQWTSTAERTQNVTGSVSARMPGSVMEDVTEVQASGENPPSETKERGVDGSASSKWLDVRVERLAAGPALAARRRRPLRAHRGQRRP